LLIGLLFDRLRELGRVGPGRALAGFIAELRHGRAPLAVAVEVAGERAAGLAGEGAVVLACQRGKFVSQLARDAGEDRGAGGPVRCCCHALSIGAYTP
jgi:hypothetical protein